MAMKVSEPDKKIFLHVNAGHRAFFFSYLDLYKKKKEQA